MSLFNLMIGVRYVQMGQRSGRFALQGARSLELGKTQRLPAVFFGSSAVMCRSSKPSTVTREVHPGYAKLRATMERFQVDDGVPVHLKAGVRDRVLYYLTFVLLGWGLIGTFRLYYPMAFPKKPI